MPPNLPLKQAAENTGILMGSMFKVSKTEIDPEYSDLIINQLSVISSENPCKMKNLAPDGPDTGHILAV